MVDTSTFLRLEIIDYNKQLLITKLELLIERAVLDVNSNILMIDINNFPANVDDYYVETLILYSENPKQKINYRIRIVKNQINYNYIKLNEINNKSFEIMYFNKNINNLPSKLNVKINDKEYHLCESCKSDIPFIRKFSIINCDSNFVINNNQEICTNIKSKGSYEVDFIFQNNNNYNMKIKEIAKEEYPKLKLSNYLELETFAKEIKDNLNNNLTRAQFSKFLTLLVKKRNKINIPNYIYFITNKVYPIGNIEYNLLINYIIYLIAENAVTHTESFIIFKTFFYFVNLLEKKMKSNLINQRDILSFCYWFKVNYTFMNQYKRCLDEKIDNYEEIYDNGSTDWIDFELLFIKECNKESSYSKAFNLLEKVINNLTPKSSLLEILYFIDSGTAYSINKKQEGKSFNLSMISKDNIKTHLNKIIPNIIVRKKKNNEFTSKNGYAEYKVFSGITIIYEETLFQDKLKDIKKILSDGADNDNKYVIPIFLILLHEICSHSKLAARSLKIQSPNIFNNPHNNYKELKMNNAESGRILEFYISKDINQIKFLKFSFTSKSKLLDEKLWIDENFEKLNKVTEELMKNAILDYLKYEMSYFPNDNEDSEDSDDNEDKDDLDNEKHDGEEDKPDLKFKKKSKKKKSWDIPEKILICG